MPDRGLRWSIARLSERANELAGKILSFEQTRTLLASPITVATSLHEIAENNDPHIAPEVFGLPNSVHSRFREKALLYREANILLALRDRQKPSQDDNSRNDSPFEPVILEYEQIIFGRSTTAASTERRQAVEAALKDLNIHRHPPMGNIYDFARDWSRTWLADIGHNEMNPETLSQLSMFWISDYSNAQKTLEDFVK